MKVLLLVRGKKIFTSTQLRTSSRPIMRFYYSLVLGDTRCIRVSQAIGINVQTGKLMLATSFSGWYQTGWYMYPKGCGKTKKYEIFLISSIDSNPSKF